MDFFFFVFGIDSLYSFWICGYESLYFKVLLIMDIWSNSYVDAVKIK